MANFECRPDRRRRRSAQSLAAVATLTTVAAVVYQLHNHSDLGDVLVYRHGSQHLFSRRLYTDMDAKGHGFTYPPFSAAVMTLFSWLSVRGMWLVLVILSTAAFGVLMSLSLSRAWRRLGDGEIGVTLLFCICALSQPVTATLIYGQVNLLLAAAVAADVLVIRRGWLVGLATAIKLTPGVFILFLVVQRRYREARVATGVLATTIIAGFAIDAPNSRQYWFHNLAKGTGVGDLARPRNQSIRGLAERTLGHHAGAVVWLVLAPITLGTGLYLAHRLARRGLEVVAVGVVGIVGCLVSPLSWHHHWVWIVPLGIGLAVMPNCNRHLRWWLAAVGLTLDAWTLAYGPLHDREFHIQIIGYVPMAMATLLVALVPQRRASLPTLAPLQHEPAGSPPIERSQS